MRRQNWGLYAIALAILIVGLVWAGGPTGTLFVVGLALMCPVMMFFMMRGMHGGDGESRADGQDTHDHSSTLDRR